MRRFVIKKSFIIQEWIDRKTLIEKRRRMNGREVNSSSNEKKPNYINKSKVID